MVVFDGEFDGKQVVFEKAPEGLAPGTKVRVVAVKEGQSAGLAAIAAMAIKGGLPPDFAAQHHHYMKGVTKRPTAFADIAAKAIKSDLPPDFAARHEHYTKGTPKK